MNRINSLVCYSAALILFFMPLMSQSQSVILPPDVIVANNNNSSPTGANVYTTLQEAIDAAQSGNIIHIVPSPTSYGSATINKELKVYGVGYNPGTQKGLLSRVDNINIETASASGTFISGLDVTRINIATSSGPAYTLSDIHIDNNAVDRITQTTTNIVEDLIISRNVMRSIDGLAISLATDGNLINADIANNIIMGRSDFFGNNNHGSVSAGNFTTIRHNVFLGLNSGTRNSFRVLVDCIVTNNIFYGRSASYANSNGFIVQNCVFSNNLSFSVSDNTLPPATTGIPNTGSDNIEGQDPLFVNFPTGNGFWSFTYDANLQDGSPAKGAGTGGEDLGIMDGPYPFNNTGIELPLLKTFNTQGMVNQGEMLKVEIEASNGN